MIHAADAGSISIDSCIVLRAFNFAVEPGIQLLRFVRPSLLKSNVDAGRRRVVAADVRFCARNVDDVVDGERAVAVAVADCKRGGDMVDARRGGAGGEEEVFRSGTDGIWDTGRRVRTTGGLVGGVPMSGDDNVDAGRVRSGAEAVHRSAVDFRLGTGLRTLVNCLRGRSS